MVTIGRKLRWVAVPAMLGLFAAMGLAPAAAVGRSAPASRIGHRLSGGITFDHSTIVDPYYLVGEPNIAFDKSGNIFASGPDGTTTQISVFWKSSDGGTQWHTVGVLPPAKPDSVSGGGDTEFTIDKNDNIYASDLQALQCQSTFISTDHGNTFTTGEGCLPETDRQWMGNYTGTDGITRVYLGSNNLGLGCYLLVSTDGGHSYLPPGGAGTTGVIDGNDCEGRFVVDQRNGNIFEPMSGGGIEKSSDGGVTWHLVGNSGAQADLFSSLAEDSAGNLYQAWTDQGGGGALPRHVFLAVSKDGGATWKSFQVNSGPLQQFIMPWVVAGSSGRVAVVYYGTTDTGSTGGYAGSPSALWHVYTGFTTNATAKTPKFTQVQTDEHAMHRGAICDGGFPGCLLSDADRSMADFFEVGMDPSGRVYVVYNDNSDISTVSNIGRSYVAVARERTGPSLVKGNVVLPTSGNVSIDQHSVAGHNVTLSGSQGLPPGNWTNDAAGDALYPAAPVAGPNIAAMDVTQASASDDGNGNLTFKMSVADLSAPALATAEAQAGAPVWAFTFEYGYSHYFVEWRGGAAFDYGQVQSLDWPGLGAPAPKFLVYLPGGPANGTQTGNDVTFTVSAASVGGATNGKKLDNVTAWTWSERTGFPVTVDQAKSFSYIVGTPAAAQHQADGYVQLSLSPRFTHPVVATLSAGHWTATMKNLTTGGHTIYVRQVLSAALYNPGLWDDVVAGPVAHVAVTI